MTICNHGEWFKYIPKPWRPSIVCFSLHPATGPVAEDHLAALVVDEDGDGEGEGGEPPGGAQVLHAQTLLQTRAVGEEGGQGRLEEQAECQVVVPGGMRGQTLVCGDNNKNQLFKLFFLLHISTSKF